VTSSAIEFKLGERGNSGCALRAPMFGDRPSTAWNFRWPNVSLYNRRQGVPS